MSIKRQFMWSMAPLLAVTVLNVFSVRLFYRYLGPEMCALWFYVITFTGMFGFADLGLGVAVGRYIGVALGKGDAKAVREYWGTGNLIAIPLLGLIALIFIVVSVWFGPAWFDNLRPENVRLLQWAFVFGGCGLFLSYYMQFWLVLSQAHLDFKFIGLLGAGFSIVQIILAIWLAYLTGNPVVLIAAGICFSLIQLGIFIWHAARNYHLGWNFRDASKARAKEMAGYTLKSFATLLVNSFLGATDRMLLGKVASPADFYYYTVSSNLGSRIQGLSVAIMGPVFHQTSRAIGKGGEKSAAAIYNESFDFVFGWCALISIGAALWHSVFLRCVLGNEFAGHVAPAFVPLMIASCLSALANISGAQLGPLNRMGTQLAFTIANSLGLAISVIMGWHWGGLAGVAWGVLASRVVVVAQDLYVIRLIGGGGWLSVRTWQHLLIQCGVGLAFYFAARALLPQVTPPEIPETFWKTLLAARWEILLAILHGGLVAAWLLRHPLRKVMAAFTVRAD